MPYEKFIDMSTGRLGQVDRTIEYESLPPQYSVIWADGVKGYIHSTDVRLVSDELYMLYAPFQVQATRLLSDSNLDDDVRKLVMRMQEGGLLLLFDGVEYERNKNKKQ
jgi:hypothetical protein